MRKKTRRMLVRHVIAGAMAGAFVLLFWVARPTWSTEMRLWKSFGDAALMLLVISLVIGPAAKLWRVFARLLPWRREAGVWFGLMALVHMVLILNGWARWSFARLFGYEFVPELSRTARMEPGFGLANLVGLVAIFWTLVLMATSSDRATRYLGPSAWRWLHGGAYVIFYLSVVHGAYFLFIHFTMSFHKRPTPVDWFRVPFLAIALSVMALQAAAFVRTVASDRRSHARMNATSRA